MGTMYINISSEPDVHKAGYYECTVELRCGKALLYTFLVSPKQWRNHAEATMVTQSRSAIGVLGARMLQPNIKSYMKYGWYCTVKDLLQFVVDTEALGFPKLVSVLNRMGWTKETKEFILK